jgi:SAM-dependent MidA family methyltransferase
MATYRLFYQASMASQIPILPQPKAASAARSQRLVQEIRRTIDHQDGNIGFDRYMDLALYHPALGYYHASAPKFGAGGDFVTAPEISSLFARRLARFCAQTLSAVGDGDMLEFGAGSGLLAAELLLKLERLSALPRRYLILELSGELRQRQTELLRQRAPHLFNRLEWLQDLPAPEFKGVVLANEVLDAMPVKCFKLRGQEIFERRVSCVGDGLGWLERPADARFQAQLRAIIDALPEPLQDNYCSELNPALNAWMHALAERLKRALVLIVDYGYPRHDYYHPQRRQGTLLCHYRHRAHDDPFFYPGLQDISASVDFTAAAHAGTAAGLNLLGYTSQTQFLLADNLDELLAGAASELEYLQMAQQLKRLTLPDEMGERFQIMALGRDIRAPQGFTRRDYRGRL